MALVVEGRGIHRVLDGNSEGKRPLGRPRHSWKDPFKIDVTEVRIVVLKQIQVAQDRMHWLAL
jgi:hypothetical protein